MPVLEALRHHFTTILLACLLECFTLPLFGHLADRYGKKRVYLVGMIGQVLLTWPFMLMLASGHLGLIYLAIALCLGLGHGSTFGAQGAFFSGLFPARIRYGGLSLVQQIGRILGGGLSPMIATALLVVGWHNNGLIAGYMALISARCGCCGPDRGRGNTDRAGVFSSRPRQGNRHRAYDPTAAHH